MGFNQTIWKRPPAGRIHLPEHTADVWLIPLQHSHATVSQLQSVLSPEEHTSAMQFLTRTLSDRFIVRRARLRMILSAYTGQNPGLIRYHIGDYGKPSIDAALAFNVSHAEAYAVCAIWNGRQIGIDIEYHRATLNMLTIAKNYFSDDEQAELATLPASKRKQGFYTCWTRKEAVIKSDGRGLHISLASFSVTPLRDESVSVRLPDLDQPLYVRMLPITSQYTCAIAVESSSFTVRCWLADL